MPSRREDLETLRDRLWAELGDEVLARDVTAISKEIRAVWDELESLPSVEGAAPADQLKRQREQRRLKAAGE